MTHVPASVGPQPFPYLDFLPAYDPETIARATQNMLDLYRQTEQALRQQWAQIVNDPLADNARARISDLLASLQRSQANVDASVSEWIRTTYPGSYALGAGQMASGYDGTPFAWSQPHRDAVGLLAQDTFDSLLRSTSYEPDAIKATVRELARTATAQALLGGETATSAGRGLAQKLADQGVFGVTYADGKFVGSSTYADMVVRTRSAIAYNAGGLNQARADGVEYFEISDGLECGLTEHDDPELADGMIVDGDIAAQFPISHPNCVRSFLPRPDLSADQVDQLSTDGGGDLSLVSDQSLADQQAFDAYLIQQGEQNGLNYTQAAAKFGRLERAGRAPRVGREPRTPRVPRAERGTGLAPVPVAPVQPEPPAVVVPAHPFLDPLAGTAPVPIEGRSVSDMYREQETNGQPSSWIRNSGAPGPLALEREAAVNAVGGNVLTEVQSRLATRGIVAPPTADEVTKLNKRAIAADKKQQQLMGMPVLAVRDEYRLAGRDFGAEWQTTDGRAAIEARMAEISPAWAKAKATADAAASKWQAADKAAYLGTPRYVEALRATTLEVIDEVRGVGGTLNNLNIERTAGAADTYAQRVTDTTALMQTAASFYPKEWVDVAGQRQMNMLDRPRGYMQVNGDGFDIALSKVKRGMFENDPAQLSVALHELGHVMEQVIPEIRSSEWTFYNRRTSVWLDEEAKILGAQERQITMNKAAKGTASYETREKTRPDKLPHFYMGKDYGNLPDSSYELFTVGMEGLMTGSYPVWEDADFLRWLLGILVTA